MGWIKWIDRVSEWTGRASAWLVVPLTGVVIFEVVMRHFFNRPTGWGYDTCWMLFGTQFMIGGAYTLLHRGHVRIDIVYNLFSFRGKLIFDVVVYAVFFLFVTALFTWAGVKFAAQAWMAGERLSTTNWFFPAGPIKTIIPLGYALLGLQSLAEIVRNLSLLRKERKG